MSCEFKGNCCSYKNLKRVSCGGMHNIPWIRFYKEVRYLSFFTWKQIYYHTPIPQADDTIRQAWIEVQLCSGSTLTCDLRGPFQNVVVLWASSWLVIWETYIKMQYCYELAVNLWFERPVSKFSISMSMQLWFERPVSKCRSAISMQLTFDLRDLYQYTSAMSTQLTCYLTDLY